MSRKEQILERLNVQEFYERELQQLKPGRGDEALARCPFHADINPSLSVNLANGLFHCFGCGAEGDLFKFYQLKHGVDFPAALKELGERVGVAEQSRQPWGQIVAQYDYQDAAGKLLFQVCRLEPKSFRQRRPDGKGGWVWNLQGLNPVPYHLPEVLKASRVYLVEGEKDADRLRDLGLTASCNPMGAGKWRRTYNKFFQGLEVVILPDLDEPGRAHARAVAQSLFPVAANLKILELPGLPEKGDVSDWLAGGGTVQELEELAAGAPKWQPPVPPLAAEALSLSDLGNARRLVAEYGQQLRYCHLSKKWFWWNGKCWEVDNRGEVERRAKLTVAGIYREAGEEGDPDRRKALGQHALRSESRDKILSMVRLAQSEPGIPVSPAELDAHPWLLNCLNGEIDLTTGELLPHDPAHLLTCLAPVDYIPEATCEIWDRFLDRIQADPEKEYFYGAGNYNVINFLQRILGYSLTGSTREQCLFIFWGHGANGKSTLLNAIREIMGTYARNTPAETLLSRNKGGEIPTDIARLDGPRFVTAKEVDRGRRLAESLVKELTGQDMVSARFLYGEFFDFQPSFKLFLATNIKPAIWGVDHAMWRRIKFVRFPVELPEDEIDRGLPEKLRAEYSGILNWLVQGCLRWQEAGLETPEEVIKSTAEYRQEQDLLADFLEDRCRIDPTAWDWASDLYKDYKTWAEKEGIAEKDMLSKRSFGLALSERGFQRNRGSQEGVQRRTWRGLSLCV